MKIGNLTLNEVAHMCNSKCNECPIKEAQTNFDWHCVISDVINELDLNKEIEVKE